MAQIDRIALDHAIAELPPGYRMVFILHDIEGYDHEEIGKILGCAVGTSKSQLHKARLRLRQFLTTRKTTHAELNNTQVVLTPSQDFYPACG
jgi:RNA polymerase sigma-70 factor (ECF subfamily)